MPQSENAPFLSRHQAVTVNGAVAGCNLGTCPGSLARHFVIPEPPQDGDLTGKRAMSFGEEASSVAGETLAAQRWLGRTNGCVKLAKWRCVSAAPPRQTLRERAS